MEGGVTLAGGQAASRRRRGGQVGRSPQTCWVCDGENGHVGELPRSLPSLSLFLPCSSPGLSVSCRMGMWATYFSC